MRRPRRLLGVTALSLLVAAVAGEAATSKQAPRRYLDPVFGAFTVEKNVVYGRAPNGRVLRMDVYQPKGDRSHNRPVLVFAHGGGFEEGHDKGQYRNRVITQRFARRGWVAASINFRISGGSEAREHDMQASVRWFRAHARELDVAPGKISVMGPSTGAVQALDTNFDHEHPGHSGNPGFSSRVAGAVSVSGNEPDSSRIEPGDPPIVMFHALDDPTIPYASAKQTCDDTQSKGNVCVLHTYVKGEHPPSFFTQHRADVIEKSASFLCRRPLHLCPAQ